MTFDASKRVTVQAKKIRRAQLWFEVKLYFKVALIVGIPTALALWLILEALGR